VISLLTPDELSGVKNHSGYARDSRNKIGIDQIQTESVTSSKVAPPVLSGAFIPKGEGVFYVESGKCI